MAFDVDNEDQLSFFNDSEFNFANSSRDSLSDEHKVSKIEPNSMNVVLFGKHYEKDGHLCGFLKISSKNGLKEGKIIMRLVTTEETAFKETPHEIAEEGTIEHQLSLLRSQTRKRRQSASSEVTSASTISPSTVSNSWSPHKAPSSRAELQRAGSKRVIKKPELTFKVVQSTPVSMAEVPLAPKISPVYQQLPLPRSQASIADDLSVAPNKDKGINPPSTSTLQRKEPFSVAAQKVRSRKDIENVSPHEEDLNTPLPTLNKIFPKQSEKISKTSILIYMYELEVFSFDFTVAKNIDLVLPFKISLDGQLIESTQIDFDWEKFNAGLGKTRRKTAKNTFRAKLGFVTPSVSPIHIPSNPSQKQHYSLTHKLEFYYLTNSGYKNYTKEAVQTADGLFGGLFGFFKSAPDFMAASCSFSVYPHLKSLRQFNPTTQSILAQKYSREFLCFKWGEPIRCRIHIDKTRLGEEDSGVTLLLHYKRCMLQTFTYLECLLFCRFERKISIENPGSKSYILLSHTYDLRAGLPRMASTNIEEFVKFIELRSPIAKFVTVNGPSCSIKFFLKVFVSRKSGMFQSEILSQEIAFNSLSQDVNIPSTRFQTEAFKKVTKMVEQANIKDGSRMMSLPFSEISLSKSPDNYELNDEEEPN